MAVRFQGGKAVPKAARKYKLGDQWSPDFDYDGMLLMFRKALAGGMSVADMERLSDSMEDVNHHSDNMQLRAKINEVKAKGGAAPAGKAKGKVPPNELHEWTSLLQRMTTDLGPAFQVAYRHDPQAEKALDMIAKGLSALRQRVIANQ